MAGRTMYFEGHRLKCPEIHPGIKKRSKLRVTRKVMIRPLRKIIIFGFTGLVCLLVIHLFPENIS
jgi:hypothetical protein